MPILPETTMWWLRAEFVDLDVSKKLRTHRGYPEPTGAFSLHFISRKGMELERGPREM